MTKISIFIIISTILAFGFFNTNFFNNIYAQLLTPNVINSSDTGPRVINLQNQSTSTSSSSPSSEKQSSLGQLKSAIFAELANCIASRECRPIMGSEGDDRITGDKDSNVFIGLGGNDIIRGGTGDNIIIGGGGDNQLYGGAGNNIIVSSGQGITQMYGGNKSNILIAGQGTTLLVAGKGNDKLYGGGGNNIFIGGPGADYFACGSGGTTGGSKSVVVNFNASQGDDTDGNCGTVLGQ
jgi:Ca2+-binding RTX toxin-like protein